MPSAKNSNALFKSIKSLIEKAKAQVVRSVNITMILTYHEIGRIIVEDEQKGNHTADYAKKAIAQLSKQLTREFGKGYSTSNLEYIRKFYLGYNNRISQSVIGKSVKHAKTGLSLIP